MSRKHKLMLNTITSAIYRFTLIICGFIVPRLLISHFGSKINGLTASISQFLNFVTLLDMGVGSVVQSALYKPLAAKDDKSISKIIKSSNKFFNSIAIILLIYTFVLAILYPLTVRQNFSFLFTASLVLAISVSVYAQYFLGMTYRLLLYADQKSYVYLVLQTVVVIINTICTALLVYFDCSINIIKLSSSIVFLATPLLIIFYVSKHYHIDKKIQFTDEPIKQKWNGLAQHIAYSVNNNTDVVVLTILSSLENVSIYNVYHLVINGIYSFVSSLTVGIRALLGDMYAKNETKALNERFNQLEWGMHTVTTLLFTVTAILIVPFVRVYTKGINDADYKAPLFAIIITASEAVLCLQFPYNTMVQAAGHFKQTQLSSIIQALINIVISIITVIKFGLVGVAIGTSIAMSYQLIYLVYYLRKNILNRSCKYFIKQLFTDIIIAGIIVTITNSFAKFFMLSNVTYYSWIVLSIKVFVMSLFVSIIVNLVLYKNVVFGMIKTKR